MKYLILASIVSFSFLSYGQYNFKENYFQDNKQFTNSTNYVEFLGNYFVNSSSINNQLTNSIVLSKFIGESLKDANLKKLANKNTIGLGLGGTLHYKKAYKNFNLTSSVGTHIISNNTFSKDFYSILFYGNEPYKGKSLSFKNTALFAQAYNKLSLGAEKMIKDKYFIGATANIYQSLFYYNGKISKGDFKTSSTGEELTLDLKSKQYVSDPKNKGLGAGIDLYFMTKFKKGNVYMHLEDLGFVQHKNLGFYDIDSNFVFKGFEIKNIFELENQVIGSDSQKTHEIFGIEKKTVNKLQWLPTRITFGFHEQLNKNILLEGAINYRWIPGYIPQVILRSNFFISSYFSIAPVLNLGGFGKSDIGLNVSFHHKKLLINCDFMELEHILAKNKTAGRGIFLRTGVLL